MMAVQRARQRVYVIDDDEAVRDALSMLLRTVGLDVAACESAAAFLRDYRPGCSSCLILDIRMPGTSGLELQDELRKRRMELPIIFLTAHGDVPRAVRALKGGAVDFIEKPHDEQRLVLAVLNALRQDARRRREATRRVEPEGDAGRRLASLSVREREVLDAVLAGKQTRHISAELCISIKTVEFHRARIREKLGVASLPELFRLMFVKDDGTRSGLRADAGGG
jgi:two-component system response regulator FixJ